MNKTFLITLSLPLSSQNLSPFLMNLNSFLPRHLLDPEI
ncbi:unnamed protein product [Brassica rapa subsp. trilocularis]